jgi:predicted nucleic acid-binding protein
MPQPLLIDTDVLIDLLRGRAEAVAFLQGLADPPLVSAVTVAELYAGVRDGPERTALDAFIATVTVLPVDGAVAARGGLIRRDYAKSHHVGIADALIAATAELYGATLVTLNRKHSPMLASVHVPYQKP